MGDGLLGDLIEMWHHRDLHRQVRDLEERSQEDVRVQSDQRRRRHQVERERDQLRLLAMALHELLEAHGPVDPRVLADKVQEIDLRDGRADGRLAREGELPLCPRCRRTLSRTFGRCLYCPAEAR